MRFRLIDTRRAAELLRRHGAIMALAALVIVGFAALAALGATDRRVDETRATQRTITAAADTARALLDRQQRGLDLLASSAASEADEPVQRLLDQMPALAPSIRAAAILDPTGAVLLRGKSDIDETALAALGGATASAAAAHPNAAILAVRDDSGAGFAALAHAWSNADGERAGIALIALDRTAFRGLDLIRVDGAPLFAGEPDTPGARSVPLGDFPLMLRVQPAPTAFRVLRGAWPFVALAVVGVTAMLSLVALLVGRLNAAEDTAARRADIERDLRDELAAAAASADRAGELSRAKSQFFAQVTHELRTPLNAILGFAETIRQEMFGPVTNARYLEYAGLIQDAGSHLLSLINDLLDTARIEAGKMEMEIAPIRVAPTALARSALDLVELLAKGRDVTLTSSGLGACPDLKTDPRAMKQVLVNLLSNAIKYTPPGGRIDLRFAACEDGGVTIEIADTGIGMSAEDLRVAFEPFGRASATEARSQQGTGLGLSLARALVRLHGGELTLASRLDSGTTATVLLPPSAAFAASADPTTKTDSVTTSARAA
jgi:signal transduction histidine kinase